MSFKKWVAWATLAIYIVITFLAGCDSAKTSSGADEPAKESMFIVCEPHTLDKCWDVVYHKDTKVMYAVSSGGFNSGNFTLLVNPDGSPMLWGE